MEQLDKKGKELRNILESLYYQDINVEEAVNRIKNINPLVVEKTVVIHSDTGAGCVY